MDGLAAGAVGPHTNSAVVLMAWARPMAMPPVVRPDEVLGLGLPVLGVGVGVVGVGSGVGVGVVGLGVGEVIGGGGVVAQAAGEEAALLRGELPGWPDVTLPFVGDCPPGTG